MRIVRLLASSVVLALIVLLVGTAAAAASSVAATHPDGAPVGTPAVSATITVHSTVPLGTTPSGGALDTTNGNVYVSNKGSDNVTVIDATTFTHSSINVGSAPESILYDPYDNDVYVADFASASVSVISAATNTVTKNVSLGGTAQPTALYFDPANGNVLVLPNATYATSDAWMIKNSTNSLITIKSVKFGITEDVVYSPASKDLYLADFLTEAVEAISDTGKLTTIALSGPPASLAYNPSSQVVVVGIDTQSPTTPPQLESISSANKVSGPTSLPESLGDFGPAPGTYDSFDTTVYFIMENYTTNLSYALEVGSPATFTGAIELGTGVGYLYGFLSPANQDLYFGNAVKTGIEVLSAGAITKTIKTTLPAPYMVYDPSTQSMFGAGDKFTKPYSVSTLYAISSTNTVTSKKVGKLAIAFLYDPVDTDVYVVNTESDTISIVS